MPAISADSFASDCFVHLHGGAQLERRDVTASQSLRAALTKAEQANPGVTFDLIQAIMRKGDIQVNMNEGILRLQGSASDSDCMYLFVFFCVLNDLH